MHARTHLPPRLKTAQQRISSVAETSTRGSGSEGNPAPDGEAGACHCFTHAASLPDALADLHFFLQCMAPC